MIPDSIVLVEGSGRRHLVLLAPGMAQIDGVGVLSSDRLRSAIGRAIEIDGRRFLVLTPSTRDLWETLARGPQILTPKDMSSILFESDVRAGSFVVEAGSGSGGMTVVLARAVGSTGRIVSYDIRQEALQTARFNVERAGLSGIVEFRTGDIRNGIADRDVDAVILDLPDPWSAIPAAWEALKLCAHCVSFSPNVEQVKETVAAMKRGPFAQIRTIEIIEREMEVRPVGVRPSQAPLGHTGYLTFARKVLDTF